MHAKHSLEELEASVGIVDVVSRYRTLVKSGKNFKALCPFHEDKSPSLVVNPDQNFCWCFACQNGGNIFSFVQKIEGCSFPDAIKIVAEIAGQDSSLYLFDGNQTGAQKQKTVEKKEYKDRLREVLEETQTFFQEQFSGQKDAHQYVFQVRKLSHEIVQKFGIGYAPHSYTALREYLLKKKFSRKEMLDAGVVVGDLEGEKDVVDKYRRRVMFPIRDSLGKICGFGGRILGEGQPKYLNSPDSELYDKSHNLYGFFESKNAIRSQDEVLFVEGNLDVMVCHQHGIENVVAISGVGFSDFQTKLIKRFTANALLSLDTDEAGMKATERMLPILFAHNVSVKIVEVDAVFGKDPDEILQKDTEVFLKAMKNARLAIDVVLSRAKKMYEAEGGMLTIDKKRKILDRVLPIVASHSFELEKKHDLKVISQRLNIDEITLADEFQKFVSSKNTAVLRGRKVNKKPDLSTIHDLPRKSYFWGIVLKFFGEVTYVFSVIDASFFESEEEKELYSVLNVAYNESRKISMREVLSSFSSDFQDDIMRSMLYADQHLGKLSPSQRKDEMKNVIHIVGKELVHAQFSACKKALEKDASLHNVQQFQYFAHALKNFH